MIAKRNRVVASRNRLRISNGRPKRRVRPIQIILVASFLVIALALSALQFMAAKTTESEANQRDGGGPRASGMESRLNDHFRSASASQRNLDKRKNSENDEPDADTAQARDQALEEEINAANRDQSNKVEDEDLEHNERGGHQQDGIADAELAKEAELLSEEENPEVLGLGDQEIEVDRLSDGEKIMNGDAGGEKVTDGDAENEIVIDGDAEDAVVIDGDAEAAVVIDGDAEDTVIIDGDAKDVVNIDGDAAEEVVVDPVPGEANSEGSDDNFDEQNLGFKNTDREEQENFDNQQKEREDDDSVQKEDNDNTSPEYPDPLDDDFDVSGLKPLNATRAIDYLGVMVDSSRHYFPVTWLKRLVDIMSVMQLNLLHLRLADDQGFSVQLKSRPALTYEPMSSTNETRAYTLDELKDLTGHAKQKGVVIVPEISMPTHTASWAGIKDLIVKCPNYLCYEGVAIPLNASHPEMKQILTDVIMEVLGVFDKPPFLHLGGGSMYDAERCFSEAGATPDYDKFEDILKGVLNEINYPESQVIRWEPTALEDGDKRAGSIVHVTRSVPEKKSGKSQNFFISTGLRPAWTSSYDSFDNTQYLLSSSNAKALVASTLELGREGWRSQFVVGRLLSVAIGATEALNDTPIDSDEYSKMFSKKCREVGFPLEYCVRSSESARNFRAMSARRADMREDWTRRTCERLTYDHDARMHRRREAKFREDAILGSNKMFWEYFGKNVTETSNVPIVKKETSVNRFQADGPLASFRQRLVRHTGVILGMTNTLMTPAHGEKLISEILHPLGINLMQTRLADDYGFAMKPAFQQMLVNVREINHSPTVELTKGIMESIVKVAGNFGVEVMPEISISSNAGGWVNNGMVAACPKILCDSGKHIPHDINNSLLLPVLSSVIRELLNDVTTSNYIHLGTDERRSSMPCFEEAEIQPDFKEFEDTLLRLLAGQGIDSDRIVRWENEENVVYPDRTGSITQCKHHCPPNLSNGKPSTRWFGAIELESQGDGMWQIYNETRNMAGLNPIGVLADMGNADPEVVTNPDYLLREKLLAFSMGTADVPAMTREQFEEKYKEYCTVIFGKDDCAETVLSKKSVVGQRYQDSDQFKQEVCDEFTYVLKKKRFREEGAVDTMPLESRVQMEVLRL